jgi:WD40 repeat protein
MQGVGNELTPPTGMKRVPSGFGLDKLNIRKSTGPTQPSGTDHSSMIASRLRSHPFLPMYISGSIDGVVCLWQYGQSAPLRMYKPSGSQKPTRITCIHFTSYGHKFGVGDKSGFIHVYKFDPSPSSSSPFITFRAHSQRCCGFAFIDSGSLIASIGTSNSGHSLKMWDLLLPEHDMNVLEVVLEFMPSSVTYSSRNQCLIIGGKGEIAFFDLKTKKLNKTMHEHSDKVTGLVMDRKEQVLISTSYDKTIKVWNLKTFELIEEHTDTQITDCEWIGEFVYCATTSGLVTRRRHLE